MRTLHPGGLLAIAVGCWLSACMIRDVTESSTCCGQGGATGGAVGWGGTGAFVGAGTGGTTTGGTEVGGGSAVVSNGCEDVTTWRYFCDDFESGLSKWNVAIGGWDTVTSTYQSPTHSVTDSPTGNYAQGAYNEISLVDSVDLRQAVDPIVTFWHRLELAGDPFWGCSADWPEDSDHSYLEVSIDGGSTWTQLAAGFCGSNTTTWVLRQFSLADYVGQQIKLRFRVEDQNDGAQADGWTIDDVEIRELTATSAPGSGGTGGGDAVGTGGESSGAAGGAAPVAGAGAAGAPGPGLAGAAGFGGASGCPSGTTLCNEVCVDTNTDNGNCGACGVRCESGLCAAGLCPAPCASSSHTPRYFCDDFETGLDQWEVGGFSLTESRRRSATHSLTDSAEGNYPRDASSMVVLAAPIDLSAATAPVLDFWHILQLYSSGGTDAAIVEISTDGGFTWTEITRWTAVQYGSWSPARLDLTAYAGQSILLRFTLRDDGGSAPYSTDPSVSDGWYLDDLQVRELGCDVSGNTNPGRGGAGGNGGGAGWGGAGAGTATAGRGGSAAAAPGVATSQAGAFSDGGAEPTLSCPGRTSSGCGTEAATTRYFCEDFECGLSQWEAGGSWTTTTLLFREGAHAITDSPDGAYAASANSVFLTAVPIDLTDAQAPVLQFWQVMDLCSSVGSDTALVEVSADCGLTWTELGRWTANAYSTWSLAQLDLAPYAGQRVDLRFTLRDDGGTLSFSTTPSTCDGWTIDDIEVRELD